MRRRDDHGRRASLLCFACVLLTDTILAISGFSERVRRGRRDRDRRREYRERMARASIIIRHRPGNQASIRRITIRYPEGPWPRTS